MCSNNNTEIYYIPNPAEDGPDYCVGKGWITLETILEQKEEVSSLDSALLTAKLGAIAENGAVGDPSFLYLPDGLFYTAVDIESHGWMLLPAEALRGYRATVQMSKRGVN